MNNHSDTEQFATVESIKEGEFVKRKVDAKAVYTRGHYDRSTKTYSLTDHSDACREIFVKKGTKLFVGFSY